MRSTEGEREATESVRTVDARRATEQWATRLFARMFVWLGVPGGLAVLVHGLLQGHTSPFLIAHSLTMLSMGIAAFTLRDRHDLLKPILSGGMVLVSLFSLLHFGPNFGAALVLTTAVMLATLFYGPRGAIAVVLVALIGLSLNATVLVDVDWSRPPAIPTSGVGWGRLAVTTVAALVAVAWGFHTLLIRLHRAVVAEADASTREREAQREREHALHAYSASQRLEAVGRLAGGVSHDVNNALTIVRSGANALRDEELTEAEREEIIGDIDGAARAAATTTRQLIALSRGLPDDGGPADPVGVIEAVTRSLTRLFPENIHVHCEVEPCPRTTMGEDMMTQVLLNLALNARDACFDGGRITLHCEAPKSPLGGDSNEVSETVLVRVIDDGTGIAEEDKARMFEPFFSTKTTDASGMGLPMVQAAVSQCGGDITVESEVGQGTTVVLRLPVAQEQTIDAAPVADVVAGDAAAKVLLVEDQPQLLRAMSRELRRGGFAVTATSCLRDARTALEEESFDLLCTDGILADGRAHDVIAAMVSSQSDRVPVLVCSGYLPDELDLGEQGEVKFLRKPYAPGELVATAQSLVE